MQASRNTSLLPSGGRTLKRVPRPPRRFELLVDGISARGGERSPAKKLAHRPFLDRGRQIVAAPEERATRRPSSACRRHVRPPSRPCRGGALTASING